MTISTVDGLSASVATSVTVGDGTLPVVRLLGIRALAVNPTQKVTLLAEVSSTAPATLRTQWSSSPPLNLTDSSVSATQSSSVSLVLQPNALQPGLNYTFRLTAQDIHGAAFAEMSVPAAAAPGAPLSQQRTPHSRHLCLREHEYS